jgi:hypothetical protein
VVLEGGFKDAYDVRLNRAPASGETVTVTLTTDGQVTLDKSQLEFTSANWSQFQRVTITASDDAAEENVLTSQITHHFSTVMANPPGGTRVFATVADATLDVKVYDSYTVNVIVRETSGSTRVIKDGVNVDSYYLILTRQPTQDVTVAVQTDGQSYVRLASAGSFAPQLNLVFTPLNWQTHRC